MINPVNIRRLFTRKRLIAGLFLLILINLAVIVWPRPKLAAQSLSTGTLPTYTAQELSNYNATDPAKPVLLAMEGKVYDVSSGAAEYYQPGKPYHFLVGKDSTAELNFAGGAIIKRKYPVVGYLVNP